MENLFTAPAFIFIGLTVLYLVLITRLIYSIFKKTNAASAAGYKIIAGLYVWIVFLTIGSLSGFFSDLSKLPPPFALVILPPLIFLIFFLRTKSSELLVANMSQEAIITAQVFRIIVEIALWMLFVRNLIPVQMSFEGTNFDILAGLTAPVFVWLKNRFAWGRKAIITWNILGLLLLINIVVTSILSAPTPFRVFMNEPANTIVALFPYVLLPGFLVPLAYYLHALSIKKALADKK